MKKVLLLVLIFLNLCSILAFGDTFNVDKSIKVYDDANLFTVSDKELLSKKANEIADRQNIDFVIVTINNSNGKSSKDYADDFYDYNGFGLGSKYSGILLLINMGAREDWISTYGEAIDLFDDAAINNLLDVMSSDLGNEKFYSAANKFLSAADEHITSERMRDLPLRQRYSKGQIAAFCAIVSLVVSSIALGIMFFLHRLSLSPAPSASIYTGGKGILLYRKIDNFMTTHTSRREIPRDSGGSGRSGTSTHTSSSGRIHGGGGRKF
ncbi:MAG: TPM domain-containing protein [Oscillospiraceae bacterium]|nr:TPM domain-containing protein [Oscillospiraceae bacterium]